MGSKKKRKDLKKISKKRKHKHYGGGKSPYSNTNMILTSVAKPNMIAKPNMNATSVANATVLNRNTPTNGVEKKTEEEKTQVLTEEEKTVQYVGIVPRVNQTPFISFENIETTVNDYNNNIFAQFAISHEEDYEKPLKPVEAKKSVKPLLQEGGAKNAFRPQMIDAQTALQADLMSKDKDYLFDKKIGGVNNRFKQFQFLNDFFVEFVTPYKDLHTPRNQEEVIGMHNSFIQTYMDKIFPDTTDPLKKKLQFITYGIKNTVIDKRKPIDDPILNISDIEIPPSHRVNEKEYNNMIKEILDTGVKYVPSDEMKLNQCIYPVKKYLNYQKEIVVKSIILRYIVSYYLCTAMIDGNDHNSNTFYKYFIPLVDARKYKDPDAQPLNSSHRTVMDALETDKSTSGSIFKQALINLLQISLVNPNSEDTNPLHYIFYGLFTPTYRTEYSEVEMHEKVFLDYKLSMIDHDIGYKDIADGVAKSTHMKAWGALANIVNAVYNIIFLNYEYDDDLAVRNKQPHHPNGFHIVVHVPASLRDVQWEDLRKEVALKTQTAETQAIQAASAAQEPKEHEYSYFQYEKDESLIIKRTPEMKGKLQQHAVSEPLIMDHSKIKIVTHKTTQLNNFGSNCPKDYNCNAFAYMSALMYKPGDVIEEEGQDIDGWKLFPLNPDAGLHIKDEDSPFLKKNGSLSTDPGYNFKYVLCTFYKYDQINNNFKIAFAWRGSESKRDFVYNAKTILENPVDAISMYKRILIFQFRVVPYLANIISNLTRNNVNGLRDIIVGEEKPEVEYYVTGHSLGGYMALLSAVIMKMENSKSNIYISLFNPFMGNFRFNLESQSPGNKKKLTEKAENISNFLLLFPRLITDDAGKYNVYRVVDKEYETLFQSDFASDYFSKYMYDYVSSNGIKKNGILSHECPHHWTVSFGIITEIANTHNLVYSDPDNYTRIDDAFTTTMNDKSVSKIGLVISVLLRRLRGMETITKNTPNEVKQSITHAHSMGHFLGEDNYNKLLKTTTDLVYSFNIGAKNFTISMNGIGVGTLLKLEPPLPAPLPAAAPAAAPPPAPPAAAAPAAAPLPVPAPLPAAAPAAAPPPAPLPVPAPAAPQSEKEKEKESQRFNLFAAIAARTQQKDAEARKLEEYAHTVTTALGIPPQKVDQKELNAALRAYNSANKPLVIEKTSVNISNIDTKIAELTTNNEKLRNKIEELKNTSTSSGTNKAAENLLISEIKQNITEIQTLIQRRNKELLQKNKKTGGRPKRNVPRKKSTRKKKTKKKNKITKKNSI